MTLRLTALSLAAVLSTFIATTRASAAHRCPDIHERGGQSATHVRARGMGCRLARQGVETYLGSPQGCLTSAACTQSGVDDHPASRVTCTRRGHRVSCAVFVRRLRGHVHFVVHPIGYPGVRGTRP